MKKRGCFHPTPLNLLTNPYPQPSLSSDPWDEETGLTCIHTRVCFIHTSYAKLYSKKQGKVWNHRWSKGASAWNRPFRRVLSAHRVVKTQDLSSKPFFARFCGFMGIRRFEILARAVNLSLYQFLELFGPNSEVLGVVIRRESHKIRDQKSWSPPTGSWGADLSFVFRKTIFLLLYCLIRMEKSRIRGGGAT